MPDNITAPATGATLATDELAGVHYPRTKLSFGADGSAEDVSDETPLPVKVDGGSDTTAANQAAILAAVQALAPMLDGLAAVIAAIQSTTYYPPVQAVSADALPLPQGAATQATLASLLAKTIAAPATEAKQDAVILLGTESFRLADNIALAAGALGPTVTIARGGYFFFDAVFTGSSPSLKLQRQGADGATWIDVVTRTAIGTGDPIGVPNGSVLRVTNGGAGALTNVSAVLG